MYVYIYKAPKEEHVGDARVYDRDRIDVPRWQNIWKNLDNSEKNTFDKTKCAQVLAKVCKMMFCLQIRVCSQGDLLAKEKSFQHKWISRQTFQFRRPFVTPQAASRPP
jgi:hypothetical protein